MVNFYKNERTTNRRINVTNLCSITMILLTILLFNLVTFECLIFFCVMHLHNRMQSNEFSLKIVLRRSVCLGNCLKPFLTGSFPVCELEWIFRVILHQNKLGAFPLYSPLWCMNGIKCHW